jgi:transposase
VASCKKKFQVGVTVVFLDESGISERPVVRSTWAPRGKTPVLRHRFRSWRNAGAIGALAYTRRNRQAHSYMAFHRGTIKSDHIVRFLKHLRRHIRGKVYLFWDGIGIHRSVRVNEWLLRNRHWLQVHRLPAYTPELNPVEGLWSSLKTKDLANVNDGTLDTLLTRARNGRERLRRQGGTLWGFLAKADLSL